MRARQGHGLFSRLSPLAALLAAAALELGCQDEPPDGGSRGDNEMVGSARIALAQVPGDVSCVRISARGASRTVAIAFDVTPGASATLSMPSLPLGSVEFTGLAYPSACAGIATAMPNWDSAPVTVVIGSSVPVTVTLDMRRPGSGTVTVDFCLSSGNACSNMVAPCCDGLVCRSSTGACGACIPSGGTGCGSSAECCSGRGLACVDGACIMPPPLDSVVVYRVGDGMARPGTSASPVFLDYYSPAGALVFTRPMPTTAVGANRPLVATRSGTAEGLITRSQDGRFLVITGYDAAVGTANVAAATAAAVPRVIGLVSATTIDTSTALTDFANRGIPRSAATTDGSRFWFAGSSSGVGTALRGATTSQPLATAPSPRQIDLFGNCTIPSRLYLAGGDTLGTVGTALPTMPPALFMDLPGSPVAVVPNAFILQDRVPQLPGYDILWVADEAVGLSKYSLLEAGSWVSNGAIGPATDRFVGLASTIDPNAVSTSATFYLTRRGLELASLTIDTNHDTMIGGNGIPTLATAAPSTTFRGVAMSPQPMPIACP